MAVRKWSEGDGEGVRIRNGGGDPTPLRGNCGQRSKGPVREARILVVMPGFRKICERILGLSLRSAGRPQLEQCRLSPVRADSSYIDDQGILVGLHVCSDRHAAAARAELAAVQIQSA